MRDFTTQVNAVQVAMRVALDAQMVPNVFLS